MTDQSIGSEEYGIINAKHLVRPISKLVNLQKDPQDKATTSRCAK